MVGKNNALNISSQGTVYYDGVGDFTELDGGASGQVLTSNGTGVAPSFQAAPSVPGLTAIVGDSGTATATLAFVSIRGGNNAGLGWGLWAGFANSGTTSTFNVTDSNHNTSAGSASGSSGAGNTSNTALGGSVLSGVTNVTGSTAIGYGSLSLANSTSYNVGLGYQCLIGGTSTSYTIGIGYNISPNCGASAIAINKLNATTSGNILYIGNATGSGNQGISKAFIYGINGNTTGSPVLVGQGTAAASSTQIGVYPLTQYNVLTGGASNALNFVAPGASGTVYTSNGASSQPSFILGPFGTRVTSNFGSSAAPTAFSAIGGKMLGLGSSWKLTPKNYTKVRITINGQMLNTITGDGVQIQFAHGTGSAPANGASFIGTVHGNTLIYTSLTGLLTNGVPFTKSFVVTGLTAGTAYWFDLQVKTFTGGNATFLNLDFSAQELQY